MTLAWTRIDDVSINAFSGSAKLVVVPDEAERAPNGMTLNLFLEYPLSFCAMNLTFCGTNIPSAIVI